MSAERAKMHREDIVERINALIADGTVTQDEVREVLTVVETICRTALAAFDLDPFDGA